MHVRIEIDHQLSQITVYPVQIPSLHVTPSKS